MLDDDLLSHGETPHYHRRYFVSLLSSVWDQVVPKLYGRQAIRSGFRVSYGLGRTLHPNTWNRFSNNHSQSVLAVSAHTPRLGVI